MEIHLMKKVIAGDSQALLTLFEQEQDILYRTAYAYVRNEQDALDMMQDLFEIALRKIHTVKEPMYVRTWLIRCLINTCLNHLKKQSKKVLQEAEVVHQSVAPLEEIIEMLQQLKPAEQQLVYLKYFQQMKNKEIAMITNVPEGTVKSKIHFILKKLRIVAGEREDWHV